MSSCSVLGPGADQASSDSGETDILPDGSGQRGSLGQRQSVLHQGCSRFDPDTVDESAQDRSGLGLCQEPFRLDSISAKFILLRGVLASLGQGSAYLCPETRECAVGDDRAHDLAEQVAVKVLGAESRCLAGLRLVRTAGAGVDRVGSILQAHGDAALAALQKVIQGKALCGVDDHSMFLLCRRFPPGVPLFDFTARAGFPLCPS